VNLEVWREDAIVLFEWLQALDFDALPVTHKAERQALTDLLSLLEQSMVPPTHEELAFARHEGSKDMDWG